MKISKDLAEKLEKHTGILYSQVEECEKISSEAGAVALITLKNQLNNRYGWQSCFDQVDAYKLMDLLASLASSLSQEIAANNGEGDNGTLEENVMEVLGNAVDYIETNKNLSSKDIIEGLLNESIQIYSYNHDSYIEDIVLSGMEDSAKEVFENLYYWMDHSNRYQWLQVTHLQNGSTSGIYNTYDNAYIVQVVT